MKISGLSNEWKTRDGLLDSIIKGYSPGDADLYERQLAMQRLFLQLESLDGPDVWIGSSHNMFNICLRDKTTAHDWVRPVVFVEAYEIARDPPRFGYRLGINLTGHQEDHTYHDVTDLDEACAIIVRLLKSQQAQLPIRFF